MNGTDASSAELLEAIELALEQYGVPPIVGKVVVAFGQTRFLEGQLAAVDELSERKSA